MLVSFSDFARFVFAIIVAPEICNIVLCYWGQKYCSIGVEDAVSSNHKIKIFCREKSVCDAVKFRNKIGTDVAIEILKNYLKSKERNVARLMEFAKQMRILSVMYHYLEMGL